MEKPMMPRWIAKILSWICPVDLYEEIEGDLLQRYDKDIMTSGMHKAKRKLIFNTLKFIRPGILLRNRGNRAPISTMMVRDNIKIAFRIIARDKVFSTINIFGLSLSFAAGLLIFQYASYEFQYDTHHPDAASIYRVTSTAFESEVVRYPSALTDNNVASSLQEKIPQITSTTRLFTTKGWFDCTLSYYRHGEVTIFNERSLYYADPNVFDFFDYPLVKGDKETALSKPFSIVLSRQAAHKYFGSEEPIGKIMRFKGSSDDHDYTVTGIVEDPKGDSHLDADILLSAVSMEHNPSFKFFSAYTYVRLSIGTTPDQLTRALTAISAELFPENGKQTTLLGLQGIKDIHLHSKLEDEIKVGGDLKSLTFLMISAIVVIVIAGINYVNLTSSRVMLRMKEVGIRKVSGATRAQITFQFLTESVITAGIALTIACTVVSVLRTEFYRIAGLNLPSDYSLFENLDRSKLITILMLTATMLLVGFLPARIVASLNPIYAFKGKMVSANHSFSFRKLAVVFQFCCAMVLLVSVMTFRQQFQFMQAQDLKVDISNTLILKNPSNVDSTFLSRLSGFKNHLNQLAIVRSITTSTAVPGNGVGWTGNIRKEDDDTTLDFVISVIDPDYLDTYGLQLIAGRNLQRQDFPIGNHFGNKVEPIILNSIATKGLGYENTEDVVGQTIYWGSNKCLVVGVIDDFHQESLKHSIKPTLFTANMGPNISLKLMPGAAKDLTRSIQTIRKDWNTFFPNNPFDYSLLEDDYSAQYNDDQKTASLFNFFCLLALFITGLGLFALSLFTASQRTKEVSIRKVLGASAVNLFHLLTREYLLLILISSVVALPLACWLATQWLSEFYIRVELTHWFFILPVVFILGISLVTVGTQTLKVILKNPTDTLKNE